MQKIVPFLWFDDQAEEAIAFYTRVFKNSKFSSLTQMDEMVPGPKGKVKVGSFQLAGHEFMSLNGGPVFTFTPATSFFVTCETEEEIDGLWKHLSAGGKVLMELDKYPFSPKYGWIMDQFGISWQLNLSGVAQKISPFLMFVGDKAGKTEEAIRFYTSIFKNSKINRVNYYGSNQGEPEGSVNHASFTLDGEEFMAMENHGEHAFTFTPAISFYVNCQTQEEVDDLWEKLSAGGEKDQCGWLRDKYGVSWQIVPTILGKLMNDPDAGKVKRVTEAMLKMSKLDIAQLEKAYKQV